MSWAKPAAVRGLAAAAAFGALALPAEARKSPPFDASQYSAGTIVVRNSERALYHVRGWGKGVVRYRVAVGKPGKQWLGAARIRGKYVQPAWSPPAEVKRDKPHLPNFIAGGAPQNPMGPRALVLDRDQYAIHGTNRPKSIGAFASYGCIRMRNAGESLESIRRLNRRGRRGGSRRPRRLFCGGRRCSPCRVLP